MDPGSASNGGLYEDVAPGDMVEEFNDWCFEDGRTPGDTGIVKTKFGYHIMYFVSASEQLYWEAQAESQYRTEMGDKMLTDPMNNNPYEADYSKIVLGRPENLTVTESTEAAEDTQETQAAATETAQG